MVVILRCCGPNYPRTSNGYTYEAIHTGTLKHTVHHFLCIQLVEEREAGARSLCLEKLVFMNFNAPKTLPPSLSTQFSFPGSPHGTGNFKTCLKKVVKELSHGDDPLGHS